MAYSCFFIDIFFLRCYIGTAQQQYILEVKMNHYMFFRITFILAVLLLIAGLAVGCGVPVSSASSQSVSIESSIPSQLDSSPSSEPPKQKLPSNSGYELTEAQLHSLESMGFTPEQIRTMPREEIDFIFYRAEAPNKIDDEGFTTLDYTQLSSMDESAEYL